VNQFLNTQNKEKIDPKHWSSDPSAAAIFYYQLAGFLFRTPPDGHVMLGASGPQSYLSTSDDGAGVGGGAPPPPATTH
jgi:hypothetical protein